MVWVIPELGALLIGLLALLCIAGLYILGKVVAHFLPGKIGVGPFAIYPRQWVEDAVSGLAAAVKWLVGDVIRPVIHFILSPFLSLYHWALRMGRYTIDAAIAVDWLINHGIPQGIARALHYALDLVQAARAYALHLYHLAESYAAGLVTAARAYALHLHDLLRATVLSWVTAARGYAFHLYRLAEGYALRIVTAARAYAATLVHNLHVLLAADIAKAEALARAGIADTVSLVKSTAATTLDAAETFTVTEISKAITAVDIPVVGGITQVWDGLIDDVGALEGVLSTDFPDLTDLLGELDLTKALDLTGALAGSLVLSRVMTRYLRECGAPNCRNLGGLGHFLQDLLGAAGLAGLLTMLLDMIQDPEGAARRTADDLAGLVGDATGLASSLLGI